MIIWIPKLKNHFSILEICFYLIGLNNATSEGISNISITIIDQFGNPPLNGSNVFTDDNGNTFICGYASVNYTLNASRTSYVPVINFPFIADGNNVTFYMGKAGETNYNSYVCKTQCENLVWI